MHRFRRRLKTDFSLPAEVGTRLDTMIEKGFQILVGDANGADKAVQRYPARVWLFLESTNPAPPHV